MAKSSRFDRYHTYEKRGWLGIIGAVLALVGFFMPYTHIGSGWLSFESPSMYDMLSYGWRALVALVIIALLISAGVAYWNSLHAVGCVAAIPYSIFVLLDILSGTEMFKQGYYGFWLTFLGVLLMLVSPVIVKMWCKNSVSEVWGDAGETVPQVEAPKANVAVSARAINSVERFILNEDRGWRAIIGAVMALVGTFLPALQLGVISVSFYDFIAEETFAIVAIAYYVLVIGTGVAAWYARHEIAFALSFPCLVIVAFVLGFNFKIMLSAAGIGYWLTTIGASWMLAGSVNKLMNRE